MEEEEAYIRLPLMTVAEAAAYLGVAKKIIYQLIEYEQIRVVRQKGVVLVEKQSLDQYRDSGKRI